MNQKLYDEIYMLIDSGREDDWWDFKREHHHDKAALIHDIICMANNRADRDSYIIYGIENKNFDVVGVEKDVIRRNQQQITDILRSVGFAGGVRPRIEMRTLKIGIHDVDVLIIKNSSDVPYYLEKEYKDKDIKNEECKHIGKTVLPYHIYTRVVDNNTEINKNADINDVERLWKKRLGLLTTPLEQAQRLLARPDDWKEEDGSYYHKQFPQLTLKNVFDRDHLREDEIPEEESPAMYHYKQTDEGAHYGRISLFHYGTKLYSCQSTDLDGYRALIPCPEWEYIHFGDNHDIGASFRYYLADSLDYALLQFYKQKYDEVTGKEASIAIHKLFDVVMLFLDEMEKDSFKEFVSSEYELYKSRKSEIDTTYIKDDHIPEVDQDRMIDAYTMKLMYQDWEVEHPEEVQRANQKYELEQSH